VTKRIATIVVALALCLVGCGWLPPYGDPVQLLTGPPDGNGGGCFAASASGLLVVDATHGTAIVGNNLPSMVGLGDVPVTVAWRPGFTARRSGSEVEVLDPQGSVVATTGRSYLIPGGYVSAGGSSLNWPGLTTDVFWACGDPEPLP
jgi:hypothetical protein